MFQLLLLLIAMTAPIVTNMALDVTLPANLTVGQPLTVNDELIQHIADLTDSTPETTSTQQTPEVTTTTPAEQKPAEEKPAQEKPVETKPAETVPVETKPTEKAPVEEETVEEDERPDDFEEYEGCSG